MKKHYAIGIDLGGTHLRVGLVSEDGEIVRKVRVSSGERVEESLLSAIGEVFSEDVAGIGIGVAGLIDRGRNVVSISPNLPAIEGIPVIENVQKKFRVPVLIENDANVAALGEKWKGAGKEFDTFVLFTLGTGIGGGIIYKSGLLNISAEIGHMSIIANGVKCSCGNYGCLESYASARAILGYTVSALEHGSESSLSKLHQGNIYKLTTEDIHKAALDGDNLSRDVLRESGRYLGVGISNIINILSPDAIILAGGLTGAWNIYIKEAIKEASRRTFKQLFEKAAILPASLGDDAGIIGSSYLVFTCLRT